MSFEKSFDQCRDVTPALPGQSPCLSSGQMSGPRRPLCPVHDPLQFARVSPVLWMQFLHLTCASVAEVQAKYGVTERAARKWWHGVGGCRLDKVQIAMHVDRAQALDMLFPK